MNLSQIKDKTIQLLNEYSNNGVIISSQKNADYTLRMNGLIDDAQFDIAKKRKIISGPITLDTPDYTTQNYYKFKMPSDFMELHSLVYDDNIFNDFKREGRNTLVIPNAYTLPLTLYYYKYPVTIDKNAADTTELEVDIDAQKLIPYYVAGYCKVDEEPTLAIQLINEYQLKLSNLIGDDNYPITSIVAVYTI